MPRRPTPKPKPKKATRPPTALPAPNLPTPNLFDAAKAKQLRDAGIEAAAYSYGASEWLVAAQRVAKDLATSYGDVDIDQVLKWCPRPLHVSPNATGAVFRKKNWKCVGYVQSTQTSRRLGIIRKWMWLSDDDARLTS